MITPAKESSSEHHATRRISGPEGRGAGIPDRVRVPNRCLLPALVRYLRGEDQLDRRTCLVFEDLEELTWDAVCQLFSWAVAKVEVGGVLRLEFESGRGWQCARAAGLHQAHGGIELVRVWPSHRATRPMQSGTDRGDGPGAS